MTRILHIDASTSDAETSHSRRLSRELVAALEQKHGQANVTRRDVESDRLSHVTSDLRTSWMAEPDRRTPDQIEIVTRCEELIAELEQADLIVIGSPMYNFTVPSTLKAWIDHVAIAGQTFRYTDKGPVGLLTGKKAYLALSSGGVYSEGPGASREHLASYLESFLGFLGIEVAGIVRAEGVAMGPEKDAAAMQAARERIRELVA